MTDPFTPVALRQRIVEALQQIAAGLILALFGVGPLIMQLLS